MELGGPEVVIDLREEELEAPKPVAPQAIDIEQVVAGPEPVEVEMPKAPKPIPVQPLETDNGFDPQKVAGVTARIAQQMLERGVDSLEDIVELGAEGLQQFEYVGTVRAKAIYNAAQELMAHA